MCVGAQARELVLMPAPTRILCLGLAACCGSPVCHRQTFTRFLRAENNCFILDMLSHIPGLMAIMVEMK